MPEILVIDDEPNIRRMVGAILSGEGFSVRDAANGAFEVASRMRPDIRADDAAGAGGWPERRAADRLKTTNNM